MSDDFHDVATLTGLPPGAQQTVSVGGREVLLCREARDDKVWAVHNRCPHAFQPMHGGALRDGILQCPKHGACFDLKTGRPTNAVTPRALTLYAVRIDGDRILVSPQPLAATAA